MSESLRNEPGGDAADTVYIVDDDPAVRQSVELLIRSAGFATRAFANAESFLSGVLEYSGCLICDIDMPGLSGLELQEQLQSFGSQMPVIILTGKGNVTSAVRAMKTGAADFIEKPFDADHLLNIVQAALERNRERLREADAGRRLALRMNSLTPREKQVCTLVIAGKASKVVAAELAISERTVEVHRSRIMKKLGVRSVAELLHATRRMDDPVG